MIKLVSTMLLALTACIAPPYPQNPTHNDEERVVIYEVGGDITGAWYSDNLEASIKYPVGEYRVELRGNDVPRKPNSLFTWADSADGRHSTAWCRITLNGKVIDEKHTEGSINNPMCFG